MSRAKQQMIADGLVEAYQLPDGTPVYTDNPEVANMFQDDAVWNEADFAELKVRFEDFEVYFDELRKAFNRQEAGQPKYRHLMKELYRATETWKDLRNELITRTCLCNRERLDLPEIDYTKDTPENRARIRREELAANRDLERKEIF